MANEVLQKQGTGVTWKTTGGTYTITLTSLGTSAGRVGGGADLGATFARMFRFRLLTKMAVAPTLGRSLEIWWASSADNSNFDSQQAAGDAALSDVSHRYQMQRVGSMYLDDDTNAQSSSWIFRMPARYGYPVIYNAADQALSSTAGDHEILLTPLIDEVQ